MSRKTKQVAKRDTYFDLIREFPLVSIRSDSDLADAIEFLNEVMGRGHLDAGQQDYVDTLSDLIEIYEDENVALEQPSDVAMLRFLMDQHSLTQAKLVKATGISKSMISEMLSGKREFSKGNIVKLARCFHVSPAVFLGIN